MLTSQIIKILLSVVLILVILPACGGGGGNTPQPSPVPVDEISQSDLLAAGVPNLPADQGGSSVSISFPTLQRIAQATDPIASRNVVTANDGESAQVYINEIPSGIIAGWAVYRIPAASENPQAVVSLGAQFANLGANRVFYAVGNYSQGGWEIGGRLVAAALDAGFSLSDDYLSPQGNMYVVLAVGRSASTNPADYSVSWSDLTLSTIDLPSTENVIGDNWEASIERSDSNSFDIAGFPDGLDPFLIRMSYGDAFSTHFAPLIPAEFVVSELAGNDNEWRWLWNEGVPDISGAEVVGVFLAQKCDLVMIEFYNSNELHGPKHPYSLVVWPSLDDSEPGVIANAIEIHVTASLTAHVRGIMTSMEGGSRGPAPGTTLKLLSISEEVLAETTTDNNAQFDFLFVFPETGTKQAILEISKGDITERMHVTSLVLNGIGGSGVTAGFLSFSQE